MELAHLNLTVADIERSAAFYATHLGFDGGRRTFPDGTVFVRNRQGFDLGLHEGRIDRPPAPAIHFGFRLADADAVRAARTRLAAAGVPMVEWTDDPDGTSGKLLDPDGYVVEIYWDA